jgi:hypothetical protein
MKTKIGTFDKLTLSKETVRSLSVRSSLRAGNDGPSVGCSAARECHKPPREPSP